MSRLVIDRVHSDIKIANNTTMNHMTVSYSDHHNSIFNDTVPYKHKNWQFHGVLTIPFKKPFFLLICTKLLFQLKNVKNNLSSTIESLGYTKS